MVKVICINDSLAFQEGEYYLSESYLPVNGSNKKNMETKYIILANIANPYVIKGVTEEEYKEFFIEVAKNREDKINEILNG